MSPNGNLHEADNGRLKLAGMASKMETHRFLEILDQLVQGLALGEDIQIQAPGTPMLSVKIDIGFHRMFRLGISFLQTLVYHCTIGA